MIDPGFVKWEWRLSVKKILNWWALEKNTLYTLCKVGLMLMLLTLTVMSCERKERVSETDEVALRKEFNNASDEQKIELLYSRIGVLQQRVRELEEEVYDNNNIFPSGGEGLLYKGLLVALLLLAIYKGWQLRQERLARANVTANSSGSASPNHQTGTPPTKKGKDTNATNQSNRKGTSPLTNFAPAAAPSIKLGESNRNRDVPPEHDRKQADRINTNVGGLSNDETGQTYFAHAPVDDMFTLIKEDEIDEHVTFKITLTALGETATYTIVDNDRQQRNVLSNRASFASSINYQGEVPVNFVGASVSPGVLRREGDRWKIIDRIIIKK